MIPKRTIQNLPTDIYALDYIYKNFLAAKTNSSVHSEHAWWIHWKVEIGKCVFSKIQHLELNLRASKELSSLSSFTEGLQRCWWFNGSTYPEDHKFWPVSWADSPPPDPKDPTTQQRNAGTTAPAHLVAKLPTVFSINTAKSLWILFYTSFWKVAHIASFQLLCPFCLKLNSQNKMDFFDLIKKMDVGF